MRIGIDIDGCLNDYHNTLINNGIKWLIDNGKTDIVFDNNIWDYDKIFKVPDEYKKQFILGIRSKTLVESNPREKAAEVISLLKKENNEIIIITSRKAIDENFDIENGRIDLVTTKWLKTHGIYYDEIIFNGSDKASLCLNHNIDIMIEDWPPYACEIAKHIPVLLYKNSYNENLTGDNITPVYTWYDIYLKFNQVENNKEVS